MKQLEIQDELGEGAFGTTYKVKDGKHVRALKIQEINNTNTAKNSFKEVCDSLRQIKNEVENLRYAGSIGISPKLYDDFICIDHLQSKIYSYILMDYIEGDMLGTWLENNSLTAKDKENLKSMLDKLHKKKILHQDLHSNNIMVSKKGRFYIIDYGLSRDDKESFRLEMDGFIKAMSHKKLYAVGTPQPIVRFRQDVYSSYDRYKLNTLFLLLSISIRHVLLSETNIPVFFCELSNLIFLAIIYNA